MCLCVAMCRYVHMTTCVLRDQKKVLDLLKLESQATESLLMWEQVFCKITSVFLTAEPSFQPTCGS